MQTSWLPMVCELSCPESKLQKVLRPKLRQCAALREGFRLRIRSGLELFTKGLVKYDRINSSEVLRIHKEKLCSASSGFLVPAFTCISPFSTGLPSRRFILGRLTWGFSSSASWLVYGSMLGSSAGLLCIEGRWLGLTSLHEGNPASMPGAGLGFYKLHEIEICIFLSGGSATFLPL